MFNEDGRTRASLQRKHTNRQNMGLSLSEALRDGGGRDSSL